MCIVVELKVVVELKLAPFMQAKKLQQLGKVDFDEEIRKRKEPVYIPNWFTVDAKTGVSISLSVFRKIFKSVVPAQKKLVQERQFALALMSARAISRRYLELHVRSKICSPEIQSFFLLKYFKCLV